MLAIIALCVAFCGGNFRLAGKLSSPKTSTKTDTIKEVLHVGASITLNVALVLLQPGIASRGRLASHFLRWLT